MTQKQPEKNTQKKALTAQPRVLLSFIIQVLKAVNDGQDINAACRTFNTTPKSIKRWTKQLGLMKETLLLYALCHQFVQWLICGSELYTKVGKNKPSSESEGWTIVLMDRASRFIWELSCGEKETTLFENAMATLTQVIDRTDDLSLLTDGERRYGNLLFDICQETIQTGQVGRPKTTLKEGIKVRVKNKGSQAHKKWPKRSKYQAPKPEHPLTSKNLENKQIHANHIEAFNSSLRRKIAAYHRKTNTYAKDKPHLQTRLDVYWVLHNFIRPHFTLKQMPAVVLGCLEKALSWVEL